MENSTANASPASTEGTSNENHSTPATGSKPAKKTAKPSVKGAKVAKDQKAAKKVAKPAKVVTAKKAVKPSKKAADKRTANNFDRDFGRFKVNGEVLSKGRAVHAVIAAHITAKKPTLAQLKASFPDELLKNYGIIQELSKAKKCSINGKTRYFVNKEDVLNTKDGKSIAVSNQFSTENIKPFIKHAKTLGYVMTPAK
jgi:hypothetical protein